MPSAGASIIRKTGTVADVVFDLGGADDVATLAPSGGNLSLTSGGTFENTTFAIPTGSLTINGGGGRDSITISGAIELGSTSLVITAETIAIAPGASLTTSGSLKLTAADTNNGTSLLGINATANPDAEVTIIQATISAGTILITATASAGPDASGSPIGVANIDSTVNAKVRVLGNSHVIGSGDVTLSAVANETATAQTQGGGGSSSVDAAVAVTVIHSNAITEVSGGSYFTVIGALKLSAQNTTSVTTNGDASSASYAGAGIAIVTVFTTTQAYIDTAGASQTSAASIEIDAESTSTHTTAKVSPGGSSSNDSSQDSRTTGNASVQDQNSGSSSSIPVAGALAFTYPSSDFEAYAAPAGGTVDVANSLAAGVKIHSSAANTVSNFADGSTHSDSSLNEGLSSTISGGLLELSSPANTDATAKGDGEAATQGGSASIGAGVAINRETVNNVASVGAGAPTDSHALTLEALMTAVGGGAADKTHSFDAEATSGARNSTSENINGSLGLNIIYFVTTDATLLHSHGIRGPPAVNANSGDVSMTTGSSVDTTSKALAAKQVFDPSTVVDSNTITLPPEITNSSGGVAASISLNIVDPSVVRAEIENGATVTGSHNVGVEMTSVRTIVTYVEAGTVGGPAVTAPAVALVLVNHDSATASIATLGTSLTATRTVTVHAMHTLDASQTEGNGWARC
ncbi:MAG: beta strand repeat-containing protein [Gaiellaceae bacterium]